MAIHNEYVFENEICAELKNRGWLHSTNDSGYSRELALFPEDIFAWLEDSQPEQYNKLVKPTDNSLTQKKAKDEILKRLLIHRYRAVVGLLTFFAKASKFLPPSLKWFSFVQQMA
jgi:type I restriction enzyme R subunit